MGNTILKRSLFSSAQRYRNTSSWWNHGHPRYWYFQHLLQGLFDKFGIEPLVVRGTGNDFKSAVEPYIASEMSKENRLQLSNLTSQFWEFIGDAFENEKNLRVQL